MGMGIPMGIPMGMGMEWVWGLKFNPHGSPATLTASLHVKFKNGSIKVLAGEHISPNAANGVYRISVRRRRGTVRVEGVGCGERGLGSLPEKKSFFAPKNDKFGCILTQFLTTRKTDSH